jgi:hypothetical protein
VFGEKEFKLVISPIHPPSRRHQGPLRGSAPRGAGDREIDLLVAAVADAFAMLPNAGTEIFVSRPSSRHVSFAFCRGADLLRVDLRVFLSSQLKCAHLVPTKAPLQEEAIFN